jgi:CDP-diacylglycerol--glycerol-3-phosphate 3-phosphatidyltransferase
MEPQPLQPKPTLTDRLRLVAQPVIDPIVTVLARLGVSPDLLTVLGFLAHFLFAYLIAIGEMRWAAVAILVLAPLDALDGALSRKLNRQQGAFGAFFDSTLDRLAEIVLFGGFLFYFYQSGDQWMVALAYLAATGSLMVSYARARAESLGYEAKVGILSRVERYAVLIIFLFFNLPQVALGILALFTYVTFFQRMVSVWRQSRPQE